jgi:hypothetical protein
MQLKDGSKLLYIAAASFSVFILAWYSYMDFAHATGAKMSDFISIFYVAATLVAQGHSDLLYPPAATTDLTQTPFDTSMHQILALPVPWFHQAFLYMPIVARVFVPLSYVPSHVALLLWQIITLAALGASAFLMARACDAAAKDRRWMIFPLTFFPIIQVFWQGHMSIVFGVLPISLAYWLLVRERPALAGLALAATIIKPQFLVLALFVAVSECLAKRPRCLAGLMAGVLAIVGSNIVFFGANEFANWLQCLSIADQFYTKVIASPWFAFGLPRQLLFPIPAAYQDTWRPFVYGACALLSVVALAILRKAEKARFRSSELVSLTYLVGCTLTPLVIAHFYSYDLSIMLPLAFILFYNRVPETIAQRVRPMAIYVWLVVDAYGFVSVFMRQYAQPLFVVLVLVELARRTWTAIYSFSKEPQKDQQEPQRREQKQQQRQKQQLQPESKTKRKTKGKKKRKAREEQREQDEQ